MMTDIVPENRAFYRAVVFLRELTTAGLEHVIISPGSRSAPLVLAAASLKTLKKQVVLDERSAAFMALGIGKAANKPAVLICTSGTAVANYYPAVIEARKSGVPLLLLTADRPPHLHQTGANQTINQHRIFADYPVLFKDMGEPVINEKELTSLKKRAARAWQISINKKGPVHLNFPFSKPLEPDPGFFQAITRKNLNLVQQPVAPSKIEEPRFRFQDDIQQAVQSAKRPLAVIGQLTPGSDLKSIYELAEKLEAPVLSEQGIGNPDYAIQGFDGFLRSLLNQKKLKPDLILRFGRLPASKSLLQALQNWKPDKHICFSDSGERSDIGDSVTDFIECNGGLFDVDRFPPKSAIWLQKWKDAERSFFRKKQSVFEKATTLTDGHVYHHLSPIIPENWHVFISNSFPVRDQSLFGQWKTQKVCTNRGVSGIDGITSTAMGVAIGQNKPGILFTGDLAFLHDANALLNAAVLNHPLLIVVINNRGGSLFRMLPIAQHKEFFTPYFETPQNADIAKLAGSYGLKTITVKTVEELKKLDLEKIVPGAGAKLQIIECRTDPAASMKVREKLWSFEL